MTPEENLFQKREVKHVEENQLEENQNGAGRKELPPNMH